MSLRVLKAGILDTIQDRGRPGYAHLGINPGGAMDPIGLAVSNLLVGNRPDEATLEMYFPASAFRFEAETLFALGGADFDASIAGEPIPVHTPVLARNGMELRFRKPVSGAWCYLAVAGGFELEPWLGSWSTNLTAGMGGYKGRALQTDDMLAFRHEVDLSPFLPDKNIKCLSWNANMAGFYRTDRPLRFCPGAEYECLDSESKKWLETADWKINAQSDRMAYRIEGPKLKPLEWVEPVSSAVAPGTLQLLPDGHFTILTADSQTTGGYPRIGHILQADLPQLAQLRAGQTFRLWQVGLDTAFQAITKQAHWLARLQWGCRSYLDRLLV